MLGSSLNYAASLDKQSNGYGAQKVMPKKSTPPKKPPRIAFNGISSREFADKKYELNYHIDRILVEGQPAIIAGAKKTLKTNITVDLAYSLATRAKFLGKFEVLRPARVGIMSAESGEATLQETATRIARAKGLRLEDAESLIWEFRVPRIGHLEHMAALRRFVSDHELSVLIIDPTYLALPLGDKASNLFEVGERLAPFAEMGREMGLTLIIIHHTKRGVADPFEPAELDDIAWAGFPEWARQWILLSRREKYDPEQGGFHKLWLNVGGSAGHSGLWAVDIEEGIREDPGGRRWFVEIQSAAKARAQAAEAEQKKKQAAKSNEQAAREKVDRERVVKAFKKYPDGETKSVIAATASLDSRRFPPLLADLLEEKTVEPCQVTKGNKQTYEGFRLTRIDSDSTPISDCSE